MNPLVFPLSGMALSAVFLFSRFCINVRHRVFYAILGAALVVVGLITIWLPILGNPPGFLKFPSYALRGIVAICFGGISLLESWRSKKNRPLHPKPEENP